MTTVKVQYAKTHLSALLAAVEAGEEVTIARGDEAIARLVPVSPRARELGFLDIQVPDAVFFDSMPEDELNAWEGGGSQA